MVKDGWDEAGGSWVGCWEPELVWELEASMSFFGWSNEAVDGKEKTLGWRCWSGGVGVGVRPGLGPAEKDARCGCGGCEWRLPGFDGGRGGAAAVTVGEAISDGAQKLIAVRRVSRL